MDPRTMEAIEQLTPVIDPSHPEPLFREIPEAPSFPIHALGDVLGSAAKALIEAVKAPDSVCCQSLLAAASLATQAHRNITIDGRIYPISEYFLTVAMSGERKTGIDQAALLEHVEWEKSKIQKYKDSLLEHDTACEIYKRAKSQAMSKPEGGKTLSQLEMAEAVKKLGNQPIAPLSPNLLIEEPTYEGLVTNLEKNLPSVGIFSDEGGRLVGGHAMNEDNMLKTVAGLSNLWDGKAVSRSRAKEGTIKLFGRRLSMHLMIQPVVAPLLLGNKIATGQGFSSRCLISWPKSTMGSRPYEAISLQNNESMKKYWACMRELLELPLPLSANSQNELNPLNLRLTEEAHSIWVNFYNEVESELGEHGKYRAITAFGSKSAEHVLRIAGILTLVDNPNLLEVTHEKIQSAVEIVRFYLAESLRLHGASQLNEDLLHAKKMLDWILERDLKAIYPAMIYQSGPRSIREKSKSKALIAILENHGWLIKAGRKRVDGAMRREVWTVNAG